MSPTKILAAGASALTPPGIDPDTWWRLAVSASTLGIWVVVIIHLLQASGSGPFEGDGFAMAADVSDVKATLLSREIDAADTTICVSDALDPQIVDYRDSQVRAYRDATGEDYRHKPCSLLVKLMAARN